MTQHNTRGYIGAIDQGTTSTRFLIFDSKTADVVTYHQVPMRHIKPQTGWFEEDPLEILSTVEECIDKAVDKFKALNFDPADIKAIGVANQQVSTVVWNKYTGKPYYNAILWLDTRTGEQAPEVIEKTPTKDKDYTRPLCGLPISAFGTGFRLRWLLRNKPEVKKAVDEGVCIAGTVDSWLIWNLTGGADGGKHVTDVTNAGFTMLMNINTLQWDPELCRLFDSPQEILPEIRSSSEIYGNMVKTELKGLPLSGILGDSKAALVGSMCLKPGQASHIYGTAGLLGCIVGFKPVQSKTGNITSVAYQLGKDSPACYAFEGLFSGCGSGISWLKDNLGIINSPKEIEELASTVEDSHGCYFVSALSGFNTPYWESQPRGMICGLSQFTNKAHIARAYLETVCFQTRQMIELLYEDTGYVLSSLKVDGGMTINDLLMQLLADITGIPVERPVMPETTALGAAMMAAAAEGVEIWNLNEDEFPKIKNTIFSPQMSKEDRDRKYSGWLDAVSRARH